ncbi:head-tail connector protein [Tsuneonella sp. SYSU-LHT278]|uniref:head-tail connector protein n=1 Tax=Tsuneonella sediminis TaxID=3416089 RepID=UPI003F792563
MQRTIVVPAELPGAALDELKQWLAVRSSTDDAALTALLRTALETCEAFTGSVPIACLCEEILPASADWRSLAARPVVAISGLEGIPAEGGRFTLAPDAYEIELEADGTGRVRVTRQGSAGRVAARFTAGLAPTWELLPESLRHGIVRLAAHHWRVRDTAVDTGPPAAIAALWRPWRRMRL